MYTRIGIGVRIQYDYMKGVNMIWRCEYEGVKNTKYIPSYETPRRPREYYRKTLFATKGKYWKTLLSAISIFIPSGVLLTLSGLVGR